MMELSHVTKLYGHVIGLNDLTLQLQPGAYGLVGPNGSGKTTFINLLMGQLRPTLGAIRVLGCDPWADRSVLRRIGLCPASDILYPNVSAREWVRYLVGLHGIERREATRRSDDALAQVGMAEAMDRPIGSYSLGMRQRTKLAQAIAHEPDLLILDEPYNGLDPVGRHEMTTLLQRWVQQGRSLIFASHVLHEIEAVTPSFLLIYGGRLLASGTAEEVEGLLADTPQEIILTGPDVARLVPRLIESPWTESVRLANHRTELRIAVREAGQLYAQLPGWIANDSLRIERFQTAEGNLTALFESLLRHHRGELL